MTKIIGLSGKKQSGKDTICNAIIDFLKKEKYSCKIYSFADALKQKICIEVMGLSYEQCYGTNEQKNSLTKYKWENLPYEIRQNNKLGVEKASNGEICEFILPKGFMTARDIMQITGTDIFRKYFDDSIWVNATFRDIKKDCYDFALISDVRFPSEVKGVMNEDGNLIRLTRSVYNNDQHESELALDDYDFSIYGEKVFKLNNQKLSIEDQNNKCIEYVNNFFLKSSKDK